MMIDVSIGSPMLVLNYFMPRGAIADIHAERREMGGACGVHTYIEGDADADADAGVA